jgi:hypothetical protein
VNMVMNLRVPENVVKFLNSWATGGFSRRIQLHGVSSVNNAHEGRVEMSCVSSLMLRPQNWFTTAGYRWLKSDEIHFSFAIENHNYNCYFINKYWSVPLSHVGLSRRRSYSLVWRNLG